MTERRGSTVLAIVLCCAVAPVLAQSSDKADRAPRDTIGWHVVREGETIEQITERYLGTPKLWPENLRLNPEIRDPRLLQPGQRIQVILERQVPARRARVERVANEVDKNLQRTGWRDAAPGDELAPLDGVRTRERSSAELDFDDGSNLTLTELSQVFLKDISTSLTGVKRGSIEVERGQAELELAAARPESVEIEIVVGGTVARPRVGPAGRAQTRTRLPEAGGSQVMVYGGSSEVEAGGRAVQVPRGMGTTVPEGGAPSPPEKLLSSPSPVGPGKRSEHGGSRAEDNGVGHGFGHGVSSPGKFYRKRCVNSDNLAACVPSPNPGNRSFTRAMISLTNWFAAPVLHDMCTWRWRTTAASGLLRRSG